MPLLLIWFYMTWPFGVSSDQLWLKSPPWRGLQWRLFSITSWAKSFPNFNPSMINISGGLRKCPLQSWPVQALPPQILSRSPSAQCLLHSSPPNQWLFVLQITDAPPRGRLAIFGLDWIQSSVLPALPPPQSGLGALLRAPFCHYVMSCPGCSPWSAVIWPLGGLPPPSGECPLVQAQGPTSHLPPRASMLLSPECFGRLKGQIKCSKK